MLPSSIELRLLEMQRKLSAIAEIPKILSSTLATVSQSFGSLSCEEELYRRKCSYDEDALDYELNEEAETEEEDEEEREVEELQQHFKSKPVKEATPESDYASEANYAANGLRDEHDNDSGAEEEEELEEDEETEEEEQKTVYYLRLPAACVAADSDEEEQQQEEDEELPQSDADAAEDDSDFLSTSYTWNPRNVPKLRINDAASACNLTQQLETHNAIDISKVRAATPTPTPTPTPTAVAAEAQVSSVPVISANPNSASSTASQKVKAINELPH